jgi:hypothetical protein
MRNVFGRQTYTQAQRQARYDLLEAILQESRECRVLPDAEHYRVANLSERGNLEREEIR